MLIFDGSDLVGKSTLASRAVNELNDFGLSHMLMHLSRPPASFDCLSGYVEKMSTMTVWDRFHLSNIAYRAHDEHPTMMKPWKLDMVEAHMRLVGGFSIIVTANDELLRSRYAERGDALYSLDHILRVNDTFAKMAHTTQYEMRGDTYRYHIDAHLHVTDDQDAVNARLSAIVDDYMRRLLDMNLIDVVIEL